jgi:hypothetical protein
MLDCYPLYFDNTPSRIHDLSRPYHSQINEISYEYHDTKYDPAFPKSPIYRMIMVQSRIRHRVERNPSNHLLHYGPSSRNHHHGHRVTTRTNKLLGRVPNTRLNTFIVPFHLTILPTYSRLGVARSQTYSSISSIIS